MSTDEKLEKIKHILKDDIYNYMNSLENEMVEGFRIDIGVAKFDVPIPDMDDIFNSVKQPIADGINNGLIRPINKIIHDGVNFAENIINNVLGVIQTAVDGIFKGILAVVDFINMTASRFKQMGKGLNDIFTGLFVTETTALGKGLQIGFDNIGILLKWTGEFIFSYITCGVQYIQNLHKCIAFYLIDAMMHIWYMPVRLILWSIKNFIGVDIYFVEKLVWDKIYEADSFVYRYLGMHFAHYPKGIRDQCYNCKRMKIDALKGKVKQINYDFSTKLPNLLQSGVKEMQAGGIKFSTAFNDDYKIPKGEGVAIDAGGLKSPSIPKINNEVNDPIPLLRI